MALPNTRSIYGATYAPIDWKDRDDPGSESLRSEKVKKFTANRVYDKGSILTNLLADRAKSKMIVSAFRQKHLYGKGTGLSEDEKRSQSALLDLNAEYCEGRSYKELVSNLHDVSFDTLTRFVKNWLGAEYDLLVKAIDDWKATAREEIDTDGKTDVPQKVVKEIEKVRDEIDKRFLTLSHDIASLRQAMGAKDRPSGGETIDLLSNGSSYGLMRETSSTLDSSMRLVQGQTEENSVAAKTLQISLHKARIWNRMWKNEERQNSARLLGTYLFSGEKLMQGLSRVMAITSEEDLGIS